VINLEERPLLGEKYHVGTVLDNRYQVSGYLGHGAMGLVLKCIDLNLDNEPCVIKLLLHEAHKDRTAFFRFKREVILSRRLSHPNIVKIYDFGQTEEDNFYISMEYIDGECLKDSLDRFAPDGLPFDKACEFLFKVAEGLSYAHKKGIIHRDIKPANILLSKDYEVKITDLGVAKAVESKDKLTATDEAIGSPVYMAPEQLNSNSFDHRADIYSFGIMAYELFNGEPPFYSDHWISLVKMHMNDPIPEFAGKASKIPFWAEALVRKCCEKDPQGRFQDASEIVQFIAENCDYSAWSISSLGTKAQCSQIIKFVLIAKAVLLTGLITYIAFS
jgi:serine/threonine protein kinase